MYNDEPEEYENIYYRVVFEMPTYSDSFKVYTAKHATEKYQYCVAENKKDSDCYKNIRILKVTETRNSEIIYPLDK
jgi:hypothetical protein